VKWSLDEPGMRMNLESLKQTLQKEGLSPQEIDLIYVIRPGNPAPVGASEKEWKELIEFCIQYQIRLVNDGAYTTLAPNLGAHTPLIQVAKDYPNLEWAELFSMSKALSDPGSRLGVMVGSSSFIEDYRLIKGNTDSGPNPGLMSAYGEFFKNKTTAQAELKSIALIYQQRLEYLVRQLKQAGFQQECETSAGFFTLWKVPREAFGVSIQQRSKEQGCSESQAFNQLMIQKTGIVGVHFSIGPQARPLIRYAVCSDILNPSFQKRLEACLKTLQLSY
jgi:aspartate/methionine/tyrosine aminotransferase